MFCASLKVFMGKINVFSIFVEICSEITVKKSPFLTKLAISASTEPIFKILDTFPMFFGVKNQMIKKVSN